MRTCLKTILLGRKLLYGPTAKQLLAAMELKRQRDCSKIHDTPIAELSDYQLDALYSDCERAAVAWGAASEAGRWARRAVACLNEINQRRSR